MIVVHKFIYRTISKISEKTSVPHNFQDCFNETIFSSKHRIYDNINAFVIAGYIEGIIYFYFQFSNCICGEIQYWDIKCDIISKK